MLKEYVEWCVSNPTKCKTKMVQDVSTLKYTLQFDYTDYYDFAIELYRAKMLGEEAQKRFEEEKGVKVNWELVTDEPSPFPFFTILQEIADTYKLVTGFKKRFTVVLTNLPKVLSPSRAVIEIQRTGVIVTVRGLVVSSPSVFFYRSAVQFLCNDEILEVKYADFWNNEDATKLKPEKEILEEATERGCSLTRKYIETKVVHFTLSDKPEEAELLTPFVLDVYSFKPNTVVKPGSIVEVTGVLRAKRVGQRLIPALEYISHVEKKEEEEEEVDFRLLNKLRHMPFPHKLFELAVSFEPKLYGLYVPKLYLLLASVLRPEGAELAGYKGITQIHLLLAGDPQTGKTSLLESLTQYVKPSIVAKANRITQAGLTLAVERTEGGQMEYRLGLVPLYRGGLIGIEELKSNPSIADELLHTLETGYIVRSTASGIVKVYSPAMFVFVTNPKYGKWNDLVSAKENLSFLSEPFLSRVVTLVFRDSKTREEMKVATRAMLSPDHIVYKDLTFSREDVKKIIRSLRKLPNPLLSPEALEELERIAEKIGRSGREDSPFGLREVYRLALLATATAKIDGTDYVERKHVKFAFWLYKHSVMMLAGKQLPSVYGITDIIEEPTSELNLEEQLYKLLKAECETSEKGLTLQQIVNLLREYPELYEAIRKKAEATGKKVREVVKVYLDKLYSDDRIIRAYLGSKLLYCTKPFQV